MKQNGLVFLLIVGLLMNESDITKRDGLRSCNSFSCYSCFDGFYVAYEFTYVVDDTDIPTTILHQTQKNTNSLLLKNHNPLLLISVNPEGQPATNRPSQLANETWSTR